MKKFFGIIVLVLSLTLLVGCGGGSKVKVSKTIADYTKGGVVTELEQGYTTLDNQNANAPIDANGYYTYGGKKFKTADTYRTSYSTEPTKDKFNYLCNTWTYNSEHYTNMVDGLVENDKYSNIVGAIAKGYKVEQHEDGTETWTFQLKQGVVWVENESGQEYAEVTAQDFVTGIEYVLDPQNGSGTASIVMGLIKGSAEYYEAYAAYIAAKEAGDATAEKPDFETVGVKAIDKYHVAYTLYESTPYFLSSLTYSPFLPVNAEYLANQGTDFGATVNNILVNGAFRVTEHVTNNKMVYTRNEKYYDASHVYVNKVVKVFFDSAVTTSTTAREWFEEGTVDSFSVRSADAEGYAKYVTGGTVEKPGTGTIKAPANELCNGILSTGTSTYIGYFNFGRTTYEYNNSANAKTDAEKAATLAALKNVNFRKGFLYGLDVIQQLLYYNDSEPTMWLMRGYTNRELCAVNGVDYADMVDAVFNEKQGTTGVSLTGVNNGSDPVFNIEKAQQYFAAAKEELIAAGLTEADFPIKIDVIGDMSDEYRAYEEAMYSSINEAAGDIIKIQLNIPQSSDQNAQWGSVVNNYDFSLWSGWGPDYADPKTFLHTFVVGGDMVEQLGFVGPETAELEQEILGEYTELYNIAAAIVDPAKTAERYQAFAEAEYALIYEYALIIPWLSQNGYSASVSRTVPYQAGRASYGLTADKLKNVVVSQSIINQELREAVVNEYNANRG